MTKALESNIRKIVNGLLYHDDGVEFGDGYHDDCKREADEATHALLELINEARVEELEAIYKKIDTGNVYLGLGKITERIAQLTRKSK